MATMTGNVFVSFRRKPYFNAGNLRFSIPMVLSMQFLASICAASCGKSENAVSVIDVWC